MERPQRGHCSFLHKNKAEPQDRSYEAVPLHIIASVGWGKRNTVGQQHALKFSVITGSGSLDICMASELPFCLEVNDPHIFFPSSCSAKQ